MYIYRVGWWKTFSVHIYICLWQVIFQCAGKVKGRDELYWHWVPEVVNRGHTVRKSQHVPWEGLGGPLPRCRVAEGWLSQSYALTADIRAQGESEASNSCSKAVFSQLCSLKPSESAERDAKVSGPSCHFTQSRFIKKNFLNCSKIHIP